jgi:hypothetical protein
MFLQQNKDKKTQSNTEHTTQKEIWDPFKYSGNTYGLYKTTQ